MRQDAFTYTLADDAEGGVTGQATLIVNRARALVEDRLQPIEDAPLTFDVATLMVNHRDADALALTAVGNAAKRTVRLAGGIVTFTPRLAAAGALDIGIVASDAGATVADVFRPTVAGIPPRPFEAVITAPVADRVHELQAVTVGGDVPSATTIAQIIAVEAAHAIEFRVPLTAIDPEQAARLRFSAFIPSTTPEIAGTVTGYSPTTVVDAVAGASFHRVAVAVPEAGSRASAT